MATKKSTEKPATPKAVKEPKVKAVKEPKVKAVKEPKVKAVKEPKVKKEPKGVKPFEHDERVLSFVGKTLKHTERDGTTHECEVRADGFYVGGTRYNSASAAAKPLQPVVDDKTGATRAVNGLVYWNIVKTPRAAISSEAALESAQKAIDRALKRSAVAVENAGEKKAPVRRALESAAKKIEKMIESIAA